MTMKRFILAVAGFVVLALAASAAEVDRQKLDSMLAKAAAAQRQEYFDARNEIVALGRDALPLLLRAASDGKLTWQQRLVARICHERIAHGAEIEALQKTDWRDEPGYDKSHDGNMGGPGPFMGEIVTRKCQAVKLWYYYIELAWKPERYPRHGFLNWYWGRYCANALVRQPEHAIWCKAAIEWLENTDIVKEGLREPDLFQYTALFDYRAPSAVPVLVRHLEYAYKEYALRKNLAGSELHEKLIDTAHGENISFDDSCQRYLLSQIMDFADSRHVKLLDDYITAHPVMEPLRGKLAAVKARPAPPEPKEPEFRPGDKPAAGTPETVRFPQNAHIDLGERPKDDEDWKNWSDEQWITYKKWIVEHILKNYPMEIRAPDGRVLVVRTAKEPSMVLLTDDWSACAGNDFCRFTMQNKKTQQEIGFGIKLYSTCRAAFTEEIVSKSAFFNSCQRMNTLNKGVPIIPVKDAFFVMNFDRIGGQYLTWGIGNVGAALRVTKEGGDGRSIVSNEDLGKMASRLSALFAGAPKDAAPAVRGNLALTVNARADKAEVALATPANGECTDWWLRLDVSAGVLEMTAPGKAILRQIPAEGATLTAYAISPDGKKWYRTSAKVGASPANANKPVPSGE